MRRILQFVLLLALASSVAQPAQARPPEREPAPFGTFEDTSSCGFAVQLTALTDKGTRTSFANGRTQITGALKVRLSRSDNPSRSIVVNAPAAVRETLSADGSTVTVVARGRQLIGFDASGPIGAGIFVFTGRTVYEVDTETGEFLSLTYTKAPEALCPRLA